MAWTTSASLRARPSSASLARAALKHARALRAAANRSALHARPVLFLSLSAVSLGAAAPLLPTSLITAALIVAGIALAVIGTGANLAGTITSKRSAYTAASTPSALQPHALPGAAQPPRHHPLSSQLVRAHQPRVVPTSHDWAELMARINHELRTPLNAVIGFSEVMSLEMFGPLGNERYQDYVRHIHESASDLLKSAEDTLALTALLTNPRRAPEPLSVSTLDRALTDAWAIVERKAAIRDVSLHLAVAEEIEVLSEPRALRQILVNMLSEAVERAASGAHVSVLGVADGELIEIVVSVTGPQPHATQRAGSLAICLARTLLEMQGTSLLEIETAAGGWSAVTVLDRAAQPDFFAASHTMPAARYFEPVAAL